MRKQTIQKNHRQIGTKLTDRELSQIIGGFFGNEPTEAPGGSDGPIIAI